MNLIRLRYFRVLVEEQSFTRAARRLHMSQQSLSQAIATFERELRVVLVTRDRSDHAVKLTDAGRLLYDRGGDLITRADLLQQQVRDLADGLVGRLRVGVLGVGAAELTPAILQAFRGAWPTVDLAVRPLDFHDFTPAVLDGTVDAALVTTPVADDRLVATPLYREPRAVMMSAGHRLSDAEHLPFRDILDEPFFPVIGAPRRWADFWSAREERGGLPVRLAKSGYSNKIEMLMAVAAGGGMMTAPLSTQRFYPFPGLRFVRLTEAEPATVAVVARRDAPNPLVPAFTATATRTAGALPDLVPDATPLVPVTDGGAAGGVLRARRPVTRPGPG